MPCGLLVRSKCPGKEEGRGRRGELQGQGLGDRQVLSMVAPSVRPPRGKVLLGEHRSLVGGRPSLLRPQSSDHD